ncbi:hypothetical protein [Mesorhizobium sp. CN2-181]|uniref:hypothetical protein n=1 Tax=Mesorhizobium yinganensis TaxID=3157707 RepID=UPI0032B717B4
MPKQLLQALRGGKSVHNVDRQSVKEAVEAGRNARLDYMQGMLRELRDMAVAERCTFLAYQLEIAYMEVGDLLRAQHAAALQSKKKPEHCGTVA